MSADAQPEPPPPAASQEELRAWARQTCMRSLPLTARGPARWGRGPGWDGSACQGGEAVPARRPSGWASDEWHLQSHPDRRTGGEQTGDHHLSTPCRPPPRWQEARTALVGIWPGPRVSVEADIHKRGPGDTCVGWALRHPLSRCEAGACEGPQWLRGRDCGQRRRRLSAGCAHLTQ